jgi:hypothetical protein
MNKKKIIIYSLLAIFSLAVLIIIYFNILHPFTNASKCLVGGGRWVGFSNGCVDFCNHKDICTELATLGCDCGPTRCWNGDKCQPNPSIDKRCKWKFNGLCDYETRDGYYFNEETKKCEYFGRSSGCSDPPFRTLQECKTVCE